MGSQETGVRANRKYGGGKGGGGAGQNPICGGEWGLTEGSPDWEKKAIQRES